MSLDRRKFLNLGTAALPLLMFAPALGQNKSKKVTVPKADPPTIPTDSNLHISPSILSKEYISDQVQNNETLQEFMFTVSLLCIENVFIMIGKVKDFKKEVDYDNKVVHGEDLLKDPEYCRKLEKLHAESADIIARTLATIVNLIISGSIGRHCGEIPNILLDLKGDPADRMKTITAFNAQTLSVIGFQPLLIDFFREQVVLPTMKSHPLYTKPTYPLRLINPAVLLNRITQAGQTKLKQCEAMLDRVEELAESDRAKNDEAYGQRLRNFAKQLKDARTLFDSVSFIASFLVSHYGGTGLGRFVGMIGRQPTESRVNLALVSQNERDKYRGNILAICTTWPFFNGFVGLGQTFIPYLGENKLANMFMSLGAFAALKYPLQRSIIHKYQIGHMDKLRKLVDGKQTKLADINRILSQHDQDANWLDKGLDRFLLRLEGHTEPKTMVA